MAPRTYMAGSIPRTIRATKLSHLPLNCVIGSRYVKCVDGSHFVFDVVMLPPPAFQRMRTTVSCQQAFALEPRPGGSAFSPIFVLTDVRSVTVPDEEKDPEGYARAHFVKLLRLEMTSNGEGS